MSFKECRYSEFIPDWFREAEVIKDNSVNDYQGEVKVLVKTLDNHYHYLQYDYGSCSGCDLWEDKRYNDAQIQDEILKLTLSMTEEEYNVWRQRKSKDSIDTMGV